MEVVSVATIKTKTSAEKEELIKEFFASGKSKTLWCKEKEISCQTFYNWLKKSNLNHKPVKFIAVNKKKRALTVPNKNSVPIQNTDLLLEIGICKIHISDITSMDLVANIIKAVKPFV